MNKAVRISTAFAAIVSLGLLAGCSGAGGSSDDASGTVKLRTWDENAEKTYQDSIQAFHKDHPDITVKVETVPWSDYFSNLRQDVAAGDGPDIFWLNGANLFDYVKSEQIAPVKDVLGSDKTDDFDPAVVKQYTADGKLMGIPQTSDGAIALYYNKELLKQAGVSEDALNNLSWQPGADSDELTKTMQKLTVDKDGHSADQGSFDAKNISQFGYNASQDLQAILLPFIGSNGGTYQKGEKFTYTNPKTVEAFQYVVDLINKQHVAPPAEDTNPNGDYARDAFLQGKIAVFQSGTYNLSNVAEGADFDWGLAQLPEGPEGAVTPAPGVVAAVNAESADNKAVQTFAKWLASEDGNKFFGDGGTAIPAVVNARDTFTSYWKGKDVDVSPFLMEEGDKAIEPAQGSKYAEAEQAFRPILDEMFLGRTKVPSALKKANKAANDAVTE
jgi:multiple sugar transport system substrate-binding protein